MAVYFVQAVDGGPVKIGHARNPEKRLRGIQTGNPHKLVIRRLIDGSAETEHDLHFRFRDQRLEGEWFRCEGLLADIVEGATFDWWRDIIPQKRANRCFYCKEDLVLEIDGNHSHDRCRFSGRAA